MSSLEQIDRTQLVPVERVDIYHLAQSCTTERQERLKGDGKVRHELQRDIQYCLHTFLICLPYLPWLAVSDIFVTDTCQVHRLLLCVAELEHVKQVFHLLLHILELFKCLLVIIRQLTTFRHHTVPVFLCQLQCTVHEVSIHSNQLTVVTLLEVFPCKVIVLCLRSIGGQHISQHILFAREINQIFVQPYCPVARCGNLVVLKIQELVCRHIVGQYITTMCLQHCREHDAVEHDIVLTNKVDQSRRRVLPPFLPRAPNLWLGVTQLLRV